MRKPVKAVHEVEEDTRTECTSGLVWAIKVHGEGMPWSWVEAMVKAQRCARLDNGCRYRVTGRRHTYPLSGAMWVYHAEVVR